MQNVNYIVTISIKKLLCFVHNMKDTTAWLYEFVVTCYQQQRPRLGNLCCYAMQIVPLESTYIC